MKTIVIAGSQSNIGKTALAEKMLRGLKDWSALKVTVKRRGSCPRRSNCRVCSEIKADYKIVKDKKTINQNDTDTARLKDAGAREVIWLKASIKGLKKGLKKALYELKDSKGVVIEGTSVLKHMKPDLAIYLKDDSTHIKPSAKDVPRKADIIINVDR